MPSYVKLSCGGTALFTGADALLVQGAVRRRRSRNLRLCRMMRTETSRGNDEPALTVVVNMLMGGGYLRRCIQALLAQRGPAVEVVVPVCPGIDNVDEIRREYPSVRFVAVERVPSGADLSHPGLAHLVYCRRRAAGLAAARGEIVALTEDPIIPDSNWCEAIAEAHRLPYAAIGGAVEDAGNGVLHRALYLFDFGKYQRNFNAGEAVNLTDQNVSYKRAELEKIRHVWADLYHESAVHRQLRAAGKKLWLTPDCVVRFDRGPLTFRQQLRERFAWGRVFGGERAQHSSPARRAALLVLSPLIPGLIAVGRVLTARRIGYSLGCILLILPAISTMAVWWAAGEAIGYGTARPFPGR